MILVHDVRLAVRRWKDRPVFAATAILTLALGIGATTTIFSIVHAVLLKPLPWRNAGELVAVYVQRPHWLQTPVLAGSWNLGNLSWPILTDLQTRSRTIAEVGTWNRIRPTLNTDVNEPVYGLQVSAGFLPMLGVSPYLGRLFTPADDEPGGGTAIVSYETWQRRFGGSPDVLGRVVSLDETPHTIVGVLPPRFDFDGSNPPEFVLSWGNVPAKNRSAGNHFMRGVARVRAGVPLDAAVAEIDPLIRGDERPEEKQARLVSLADDQQDRSRGPLWLLLAGSSLLLLIACANVAGLLLGEAGSRRYEFGVRLALGGSRRSVIRQMLVESVLLAAAAIVVAVALAYQLTPLLLSMAPAQLPRAGDAALNTVVLMFSIGIGLTTAIVFGIAPALSFARIDAAAWLRASRGEARRAFRAHNVIVAGEVALAILLVAGASLFGETLLRLTSEAVGFRPGQLVVAAVRVPRDPNATAHARVARNDAIVAQLAALPGVDAAAATSSAPFSDSGGSNGLTIEGKPGLKADAGRLVVSDTYFRTVGLPIIKGRSFAGSDAPGAFVAIVTREFELRYLDGDGVGKRFTVNENTHEVIGIVPDARHRRYSDQPLPVFYALNRQLPSWMTPHFVVKANGDARALLPAIRKTIESAQPSWSVVTVETMTEMMRRSVAEQRFRATLSLAFGLTALLLAAMGLYGLVSRLASDRRREIGVRLALGAQRGAVLRLIMRHALLLVGGGVAIGVPAAIAASTLVRSMLYGVTPTAPHTFVLAIGALTAVAVAASAWPAARAARTDPAVVLRIE